MKKETRNQLIFTVTVYSIVIFHFVAVYKGLYN
jgi:hypothetical protein